jgi:hypothetical protein
MAQNHEEVTKMMEELGCTGPHIKASGIQERIEEIDYQTVMLAGTKFMFCGIKMKGNGSDKPFVEVGKPAVCMDPENWRDEIGRKISFDNTFSGLWKLEAYRQVCG